MRNQLKKKSRGGVLPGGSLTVIFSVVMLVTFLLLMLSNMASSAPTNNPINANSFVSGAGSINETTNPVGLTNISSNFLLLSWLFVGILVIVGVIIGAVLIPSWL